MAPLCPLYEKTNGWRQAAVIMGCVVGAVPIGIVCLCSSKVREVLADELRGRVKVSKPDPCDNSFKLKTEQIWQKYLAGKLWGDSIKNLDLSGLSKASLQKLPNMAELSRAQLDQVYHKLSASQLDQTPHFVKEKHEEELKEIGKSLPNLTRDEQEVKLKRYDELILKIKCMGFEPDPTMLAIPHNVYKGILNERQLLMLLPTTHFFDIAMTKKSLIKCAQEFDNLTNVSEPEISVLRLESVLRKLSERQRLKTCFELEISVLRKLFPEAACTFTIPAHSVFLKFGDKSIVCSTLDPASLVLRNSFLQDDKNEDGIKSVDVAEILKARQLEPVCDEAVLEAIRTYLEEGLLAVSALSAKQLGSLIYIAQHFFPNWDAMRDFEALALQKVPDAIVQNIPGIRLALVDQELKEISNSISSLGYSELKTQYRRYQELIQNITDAGYTPTAEQLAIPGKIYEGRLTPQQMGILPIGTAIFEADALKAALLQLAKDYDTQKPKMDKEGTLDSIKEMKANFALSLGVLKKLFPEEARQFQIPYHSVALNFENKSVKFNRLDPMDFEFTTLVNMFRVVNRSQAFKEAKSEFKSCDLYKTLLLGMKVPICEEVILHALADYLDEGLIPEVRNWTTQQISRLFFLIDYFCADREDLVLTFQEQCLSQLNVEGNLKTGLSLQSRGHGLALMKDPYFQSSITSVALFSYKNAPLPADALLTLIEACAALEALDFSQLQRADRAQINDKVIAQITAQNKRLKRIDLSDCVKINDSAVASIVSAYPDLENLKLSNCVELTQIGIILLTNCKKLKSLHLEKCQKLTHETLTYAVGHWANLEKLSLLDFHWSGRAFDMTIEYIVKACPHLISLDLSGSDIASVGVQAIAENCPDLESFTNIRNSSVSHQTMCLLFSKCKKLKSIAVSKQALTDAVLRAIGSNCPNLESFKIYQGGYCDITADAFQEFTQGCRRLKSFSFSGLEDSLLLQILSDDCPDISSINLADAQIPLIQLGTALQKWKNLKKIKLRSYKPPLNESFFKNCPQIEQISLNNCAVTDKAVEGIVNCCKKIKGLELASAKITDVGAVIIANSFPELEYLDLRDVRGISDEAISLIQDKRTNLTIIYKNLE